MAAALVIAGFMLGVTITFIVYEVDIKNIPLKFWVKKNKGNYLYFSDDGKDWKLKCFYSCNSEDYWKHNSGVNRFCFEYQIQVKHRLPDGWVIPNLLEYNEK